MSKPVAMVLAAGRGMRMGGTYPKTLIPVARGEPLLHFILRGLEVAGIDELVVVTGFRSKDIEDFVAARGRRLECRFVANPKWDSAGNYHSLLVGLEAAERRDVLVVNCDVVIHPRVLGRVAAAAEDLVLAVQPRPELDLEDMRVMLDGTSIAAIGKALDIETSEGEYAGVSLVRRRAGIEYIAECREFMNDHSPSGYYEDVYARILSRVTTGIVEVGPAEYAELDTPGDAPDASSVVEAVGSAWQ